MDKKHLELQVKAALVIAQQTNKPLDLIVADLMKHIEAYHASS